MFAREGFRQVVEQARLSKPEVALLYGVSRQTVYDWLAGAAPHALQERAANGITAALMASIAKRLLPLPAMDRAVRKARIATMKVRLEKLPLAPR